MPKWLPQTHGNTDLRNRVFLTSMSQNASRFCHFFNEQFLHQTTKSFKSLFFHLACGRHVSLRHVVAIDPLIDSIPESSIDGWASAVLHLTGSNNDQSVGFLQLSSFLALAPSESIHYACGPPTSQRSKRARTLHQRSMT